MDLPLKVKSSSSNLVFLWAMILMGAFLRFHALDRQSLWDDEMSTLRETSGTFLECISQLKKLDGHPPLYFLQFWMWRHVNAESLRYLRANSAFWGVLSLLIFSFYLHRFSAFNTSAPLLTAALAFSPFHLGYSQELRPYAMAVFLSITGFWTMDEIKRKPQTNWKWVVAFFLFVAEAFTHYWTCIAAFAQVIYGLFFFTNKPARQKLILIATAAAVCFLFWTPSLLLQIKRQTSDFLFWAAQPGLKNLQNTLTAFCGIHFNFASGEFNLSSCPAVQLLLLLPWLIGLASGLFRALPAARIWLTLGLGIPFVLSFLNPRIYVAYRYTVVMHPAFLICVLEGWLHFRERAWKILGLGVLLGTSAWGSWIYFTKWEKANPKAVVAYIHLVTDDETVVIRPTYFADLFSHYDEGPRKTVDQHKLDSPEKRCAAVTKNAVLVAFDVPSDPVTQAFLAEFRVLSSRHFPGKAHLGITVYQLEKPLDCGS